MPTKSGWEYVRNKGDQIFDNNGVEPDVITPTKLIARVTSNAARNNTRRGQPSGHVYDVHLYPDKAVNWEPDSWKCSCLYGFWSNYMTKWSIRYRPCSHVWAAIRYWSAHPEQYQDDTDEQDNFQNINDERDKMRDYYGDRLNTSNPDTEPGGITMIDPDQESNGIAQQPVFNDQLMADAFGDLHTQQPTFNDQFMADAFGDLQEDQPVFNDQFMNDMFGDLKKPKKASSVFALDSSFLVNNLDPQHPLHNEMQSLISNLIMAYIYVDHIVNDNVSIKHKIDMIDNLLIALSNEYKDIIQDMDTPELVADVDRTFNRVHSDIRGVLYKLHRMEQYERVKSDDLMQDGWFVKNKLSNHYGG